MSRRNLLLSAVLVAGAIFVPAATASASAQSVTIPLALVPLQTAQFGPAGASFTLNYGSGPINDEDSGVVVETSSSPHSSTEVGPLRGYGLSYGDPFTGSVGVTAINSSVEEYRTPADARNGLVLGRIDDEFYEIFLSSPAVTVKEKKVKIFPIGQRRFGELITQSASNLNPIVRLDEQVACGRFVLDLTVTAGSASAAEHIAPHLLLVLRRHLQFALEGSPVGTRAPLPPEPREGQAPGGPDLSTLILQPSDVGQSHAVNLIQGYSALPPTLSAFIMILGPAGTYDELEQQIGWWPTATEATYGETYGASSPFGFDLGLSFDFSARIGAAARGTDTVTPVDLSSVDDPATGYLITGGGQSEALVTLTKGQAGESIVGSSDGTLQASDVLSLAQAAAARLDAGLGP